MNHSDLRFHRLLHVCGEVTFRAAFIALYTTLSVSAYAQAVSSSPALAYAAARLDDDEKGATNARDRTAAAGGPHVPPTRGCAG